MFHGQPVDRIVLGILEWTHRTNELSQGDKAFCIVPPKLKVLYDL